MLTDKAITMCLLEILKEYSDEEHQLTMKEILSKMESNYGLRPDRRTIYSAVATLMDLDYDVSTYEDNGKGYCLRGRDFEQSEVLLLADAVYSFPFISATQSKRLVDKLQKQLSTHQRKNHRNLSVVRDERKTLNTSVFYNIEEIDKAISDQKQVSFTYLEYGLDKQLHPRKKKSYTVNPYKMVYVNEHYYLVCNLAGYPDISFYRIDLIKNIEVLDTEREVKSNYKEATSDAIFAFAGTPEHISMICDKIILDDVIDKFGKYIQLYEKDEKSFVVNFTAPARGVKFWALQYLPYAEVTAPKWLREQIIDSVKANRYNVGTEK